jgi:predicted MFS family arabinose efflux permease
VAVHRAADQCRGGADFWRGAPLHAGGFVFFSHQIGSFMGVWLGGVLYDRTGSYDVVWYLAVALGVLAALVNLPVREQSIQRGPLRVAT